MGDMSGRKVFKVFNQDFVVDERYTVTKELGQGAYGIVWYVETRTAFETLLTSWQRCHEWPEWGGCRYQEGDQRFQQEDPCQKSSTRDQAPPALSGPSQCR